MKTAATLILLASLLYAGTISPALESAMLQFEPDRLHYVLIKPVGSADTQLIDLAARGMSRDQRREFAAAVMKEQAAAAQDGILAQLDQMDASNCEEVQSFWIVNAIAARLSAPAIREIAQREDVLFLRLMNIEDPLIHPVDVHPSTRQELSRAVAWGVDKIGAPDVWAMGYNGSGVLVSVVDTGVNYDHLDLQNNMWHDTPAGYHNGWDFENGDGDPMDSNGHGTHCAGSVAGDGTAGTETGVAPGATIMACRVANSLSAEAQLWEAFQFSIDHGADVISTSMGWTQSWDPDRLSWREAEENILAAGICHSVAAGNEGGNTGSYGDIRTPGDCPPPWLHSDQTTSGGLSAVVTVGATDVSDNIASFSSVGYSTWMFDSPWFDYGDTSPDIGLIDPDISGPGVDIVSCSYSNPSGYTTMSGTSMATPHLAGCMALILEANPSLSPAQVDSLLEVTALDLGASGKDNVFGSGRVQILEAVQAALSVPVAQGDAGEAGNWLTMTGANPVFGAMTVDLIVAGEMSVNVGIYDLSGRCIDILADGELSAGIHSYTWTVPGSAGSGVYFAVAQSGSESAVHRFTILE